MTTKIKTLLATLLVLSALALAPRTALAGIEYDSNTLQMKNADQFGDMIRKKIKQAQDVLSRSTEETTTGADANPDAVDALKDAMRIALSRPDQDGARSVMFGRVRRELADLDKVDITLAELAQEAMNALKEDAKTSVQRQVTYITVLENLMAEIKPDLEKNAGLRRVVEEIRDAKIEITDEARSKQRMRNMSRPVSPSETATKILPKKK